MSQTLREYVERRVTGLDGLARLDISSVPKIGELVRVVPRHPEALGVYLLYSGRQGVQVGFSHEHDVPDEQAETMEDVAAYLEPAIGGRVQMLVGPRRAVVHIQDHTTITTLGRHYGVGGWLPIPGWRRRAQVVRFTRYDDVVVEDGPT